MPGVLGMKWGRRKDKGNSAVPHIRREEARKGRPQDGEPSKVAPKATPRPKGAVLTEKGALAKTSDKKLQRQIHSELYRVTDADLKERISRIQLETQYKQLTTPAPNPVVATSKRVLAAVGPTVATMAVTSLASSKLNTAVNNGTMSAEQAASLRSSISQLANATGQAIKPKQ